MKTERVMRAAKRRGMVKRKRNRDALKCLGELLQAGQWDDEDGWRIWIVDDDDWSKAQREFFVLDARAAAKGGG